MTLQIQEARPPYVTFEEVAVEDREATIATGSMSYKTVARAIITPIGSKDRLERDAAEWFEHLQREVESERFHPDWLAAYKRQFAAWREGLETPLEGHPVAEWPAINKAQLRMLQEVRVRTIEDLAAANEETLRRLGMGARDLKRKAELFLASANDHGKVMQRMAALEISKADLEKQVEQLQSQIAGLNAQLAAANAKAKAA